MARRSAWVWRKSASAKAAPREVRAEPWAAVLAARRARTSWGSCTQTTWWAWQLRSTKRNTPRAIRRRTDSRVVFSQRRIWRASQDIEKRKRRLRSRRVCPKKIEKTARAVTEKGKGGGNTDSIFFHHCTKPRLFFCRDLVLEKK